MPQGKKLWGRNQILCVCMCVCTHRHSLSSASGKWWCRVFTKIIRSFWIDLFDYMQQSLIATASLPTCKIMITNKMCDIRLIVKIYMWSGGKPTQRGRWRREILCMQIKKSTPFTLWLHWNPGYWGSHWELTTQGAAFTASAVGYNAHPESRSAWHGIRHRLNKNLPGKSQLW